MDWIHAIVIGSVAISILAPVIGFAYIARLLRKDEAIDAAIFLAQRQLEEYVKRQK